MKLKFKHQQYQLDAVEAVMDCFAGQPPSAGVQYRVDPGRVADAGPLLASQPAEEMAGFRNESLKITSEQILRNIQDVQKRQNIPVSTALVGDARTGCPINLDIEMETGTGKTYCYIRTMFEMNRRFGWSKFIVVVPSIAIREGVFQSFNDMKEHFLEDYGKQARFFIYNSKQLHNLESFSSDAGINVMIINVQAFNARGQDNRRIYEELDDFQSRKPIDVIKANRPILILDEPQKMSGDATMESLKNFNALMMLRYSATHKKDYNKVYRLDALDAFNQKLVKKIAVRGISIKGLTGTNAYLYLGGIDTFKDKPPVARLEFEVKLAGGTIKRQTMKIGKGDDLHSRSGLDQYRGFTVSEIDARSGTVSFTNGKEMSIGEIANDTNEAALRRIQIREAIKAHFDKEIALFPKGIKVLSLFFIDSVAKYRAYDDNGESAGEYAQIFEEEYEAIRAELPLLHEDKYAKYLEGIATAKTHNGYFSVDKKTNRLKDPSIAARGETRGEADDVDAYDLILKDKKKLLSFDEPTRFIFSHSALREGWDNPNVFVIGTLKHSDNTISRRQEVGRGMRLAVNQHGDRIDDPSIVHDVNVLTVVASESYKEFVDGLQKDIRDSLSSRPKVASKDYFKNKVLRTPSGDLTMSDAMAAQLEYYLIQNGYVDVDRKITQAYHDAKEAGTRAELPSQLSEHAEQVFQLVDSVFSDAQMPTIDNELTSKANTLNSNFEKKEFQELWKRINKKAVYTVHFDSAELIKKCVPHLDRELRVTQLQYVVHRGEQKDSATVDELEAGDTFELSETQTLSEKISVHSGVKYDLIGKIAEGTQLTRRTAATILSRIQPSVFDQFKQNPEDFISKTITLINEQKATMIVEHLTYDALNDTHGVEIFTQDKTKYDLRQAGDPLTRHIYDYVFTDSKIERDFVKELDASDEVVVYAKLPRGFAIPTPVGPYNPDWAISFKEGTVKHVYFVAETKGSLSSMDLRHVENAKIDCAKKFFEKITSDQVKYSVVDTYGTLMQLVK